MINPTMIPGKYRIHFITDPRGKLYLDIEVKMGKPRAFVRSVGPPVQDGVVSPFVGRTVYLDSLFEGQQIQFHGRYPNIIHKVDKIERL